MAYQNAFKTAMPSFRLLTASFEITVCLFVGKHTLNFGAIFRHDKAVQQSPGRIKLFMPFGQDVRFGFWQEKMSLVHIFITWPIQSFSYAPYMHPSASQPKCERAIGILVTFQFSRPVVG
jgi:hypothetical protein